MMQVRYPRHSGETKQPFWSSIPCFYSSKDVLLADQACAGLCSHTCRDWSTATAQGSACSGSEHTGIDPTLPTSGRRSIKHHLPSLSECTW